MAEKWKSVREAREFILSRISPVKETVRAPLRDALGRVLAADVVAPFDVPGFDNSAMDGYACRIADLSATKETPLRIVGRAFAGAPSAAAAGEKECVRIMTGARIPAGADIVIPQEETRGGGESGENGGGEIVILPAGRRAGTHIRRAGEDLRRGKVALAAGAFCRPAEIGLLGSLGLTEIAVKRRVRAAYFSTGDELKSPGDPLSPGEIYDSNRHAIFAMLARMNMDGLDLGVVPDSPDALAAAMDAAMRCADVVVASGGASVGEKDFIRSALASRGEVLFWKVAMRPGRPLAFGKLGDADFFGLPGNPASVMVCFYQFVQAALWKRAGRTGYELPPTISADTATPLKKSPGREEYQRGILRVRADGDYEVSPVGDQGSGILSSMTRANCFIVLEESRGAVAAGERVRVQMFEGLV
ncbi:MAG: molybdopterin molybdotransferase MoeA [Gammaproteobacteria bacterium]